jgi:hypothetical protein
MHAFFDSTEFHKGHKAWGFPLDHVPSTKNWSAYDYEVYARWRSDQIALEVLDHDSVMAQSGNGWIKFADTDKLQVAMDHEMENMIAAITSYYRYLTVAMDTVVVGGLNTLRRGEDHLLLMSIHKPAIYLSPEAPWELKRVCSLLAVEMARAAYRSQGHFDASFANTLHDDVANIIRTVAVPPNEQSQRIIISWGQSAEELEQTATERLSGNTVIGDDHIALKGHITLRGKDLQSTIHLVDYTMDLTYAPFNGRSPMKVLFKVMETEWDGLGLMEKLRITPDDQIGALLKTARNTHGYTDYGDLTEFNNWREEIYHTVRPNSTGSDINLTGVLPRYYNYMILGIPLPDGSLIDLSTFTIKR